MEQTGNSFPAWERTEHPSELERFPNCPRPSGKRGHCCPHSMQEPPCTALVLLLTAGSPGHVQPSQKPREGTRSAAWEKEPALNLKGASDD